MNELIRPTDNTLNLLHNWLSDNGIDRAALSYNAARDWIKVSLSVSSIERLLDTKYSIFGHADGDRVTRAPAWSLPLDLHEHIEAIQPTTSFFRPAGRRKTYKTIMPISEIGETPAQDLRLAFAEGPESPNVGVAEVCNASAVTPLCLRTLYGTTSYTPQVPGKNQIGLTNFLGEASNRSDVGIFLEMFRPDAVSAAGTFTVEVINGGDDQQTPNTPEQLAAGKDLEGNLDAETILGIGYPTPLTAFTTGGMPPFIPDEFTRKCPSQLTYVFSVCPDIQCSDRYQRAIPRISHRHIGPQDSPSSHQLFLWR